MSSQGSTQALRELAVPPDPTVRRVLDAAYASFTADGVRSTTMAQVAEMAALGVATVYRRFPQKARLLDAVLLREAAVVTLAVAGVMDAPGDFEDRAAAGFAAFASEVSDRPLLVRLLRGDTDHDGRTVATVEFMDQVRALVRDYIAGWIRERQAEGNYVNAEPDVVAEIQARLALSLIISPNGAIPMHDQNATREFARRHLVPLLGPACQ